MDETNFPGKLLCRSTSSHSPFCFARCERAGINSRASRIVRSSTDTDNNTGCNIGRETPTDRRESNLTGRNDKPPVSSGDGGGGGLSAYFLMPVLQM
jgi:hypothetical protein